MSSASTIALPFLKSNFTAPAFTSGTQFDFILNNDFNIPAGNYIVWTYIRIQGNVDTDLGPVIIGLNNGTLYPFTFNPAGTLINTNILEFQNSQIVSFSTNQPDIDLIGSIGFLNNRPTVSGTIFFYPI